MTGELIENKMREVMANLYQTCIIKAERSLTAAMEAKETVGSFHATFLIESSKIKRIPQIDKTLVELSSGVQSLNTRMRDIEMMYDTQKHSMQTMNQLNKTKVEGLDLRLKTLEAIANIDNTMDVEIER
jgi:hypothetical protein